MGPNKPDCVLSAWVRCCATVPTARNRFRGVTVLFQVQRGEFCFMVSHVVSPSLFFIHPVTLETSQVVDRLTNQLNRFFNRCALRAPARTFPDTDANNNKKS